MRVSAVVSLVNDVGSAGFDEFYEREFASIALVAGTTCGDVARGEDIAQEALVRASTRWHDLQGFDRPGAWVRRVAINLALSDRRRSASERRALRRVGIPDPETAGGSRMGDPVVWQAVDALAPRQRAVVVLHYVEDRPVDEIAAILDIAVSTATTHLHRARSALAAALEDRREAR